MRGGEGGDEDGQGEEDVRHHYHRCEVMKDDDRGGGDEVRMVEEDWKVDLP